MGFFDWISGILGSDSREENKGSENSIDKDTSTDVKDIQATNSNLQNSSASEADLHGTIEQRVTEIDLPQEEKIEAQDKSHSNSEI